MTDHPIVPTDFEKFIGTRVQVEILPIIPAGATLKETSAFSPAHLGKIPGRFDVREQAWVGFGSWMGNSTTELQLKRWGLWQIDAGTISAGLRTGEIIDLDSDNPVYAAMQRRLAEKHFGITYVVRRRDGAVRAALFYWRKLHTPPITKRNALFEGPDGSRNLTEVLGKGQHIVIEGPHAKGKMHYWESVSLVDGCEQMPEITIDQTDAYLREVAEESERLGFTRVTMSLPTASDRAAAVSISNLMSPHIAKDLDLLAKAIQAIDINSPHLADYHRWCALFRAMWAACAGSRQFYGEHIWPWLSGNPANKQEDMEAKLATFTDSQVGAECVYEWAAQFGFGEALAEVKDANAKEIFAKAYADGTYDAAAADGADEGASGDNAGAPPGLPGQMGGGGPVPPSDTHWETAKTFISVFV